MFHSANLHKMAAEGQHRPVILPTKKNTAAADWVPGDGSVEEDETERKHEHSTAVTVNQRGE